MSIATIAVHRFWTQFRKDPQDPAKLVPVDWVEYGPIGNRNVITVIDRVSRLTDRLEDAEASDNPAVAIAHARATIIKRHYEAWRAGQEPPEEGTPLAAWNAIGPHEADLLKTNGFKTVEAVAEMTDAHIGRIQLPRLRDLVQHAKMFLEAKEQTRFAASLEDKQREIEALKAENADRDQQIATLMAKVGELADALAGKQDEAETDGGDAPAPRALARSRKPAADAAA